ncbi:MAG TPA: hypothetical protein VL134_03120 [Leptolyngbya sp.]|jgi:hypothetical protein|nr:hypothetical protein [Leptolyngbya sp.]
MLSSTFRQVLTASSLVLPALVIGMQSAQAEDLQFTLYNHSSKMLTEFYVEPTASKTWGENILQEAIAPGESATVTIADGKTTCEYGIRGEFAEGQIIERDALDLCELGSYTYTDEK